MVTQFPEITGGMQFGKIDGGESVMHVGVGVRQVFYGVLHKGIWGGLVLVFNKNGVERSSGKIGDKKDEEAERHEKVKQVSQASMYKSFHNC